MIAAQTPFILEEVLPRERVLCAANPPHQWLDRAADDPSVARQVLKEKRAGLISATHGGVPASSSSCPGGGRIIHSFRCLSRSNWHIMPQRPHLRWP